MTKVKVFRFEVSNPSSCIFDKEKNESWVEVQKKKIDDEAKIEFIINNFLEDKTLKDIRVNTVDVNYHNNARGNTIHLIYTIIYSE